jgi:hypothetical protein
VADVEASHTGRHLAPLLNGADSRRSR